MYLLCKNISFMSEVGIPWEIDRSDKDRYLLFTFNLWVPTKLDIKFCLVLYNGIVSSKPTFQCALRSCSILTNRSHHTFAKHNIFYKGWISEALPNLGLDLTKENIILKITLLCKEFKFDLVRATGIF